MLTGSIRSGTGTREYEIGYLCAARTMLAKAMQHAEMTYECTSRDYIVKHRVFEDIDRYAVL